MLKLLKTFGGTFTELADSKKAVVVGAVLAIGGVLVYTGKMPMTDWKEMATWLIGIWTGGQAVQDFAKAKNGGGAS